MTRTDQTNHIFITGISLHNHPYLKDLDVSTDNSHTLKPVIITGKNGSGKTTLLDCLFKYLNPLFLNRELPSSVFDINVTLNRSERELAVKENFIFTKFEARRQTQIEQVTAISEPIISRDRPKIPLSAQFLQYLVNRKSQQAFAHTDGAEQEVESIRLWFTSLEQMFSALFETPLAFIFNREKLTFTLKATETGETIDFNTLSDGYSSAMNIIMEIVMRMEANKFGDYEQPGIVLIDEVETHLHVSLQKKILPMLCTFFPNIQFVVTTHSPFVLSSVEEALIIDMETGQTIGHDAGTWKYSYEALVEGFFETEKFSHLLAEKITQYEQLDSKHKDGSISREEKKVFRKLTKELRNVPLYKNAAIELRLKQLGLV